MQPQPVLGPSRLATPRLDLISDHVFRHAAGELIDWPDLPTLLYGRAYRWVASLWPDSARPDGWAALEWAPGERGWCPPATLAVGDVVEFGVAATDPAGLVLPASISRWWGWLRYATRVAVVVTGPYPSPHAACAAARPVVDEIRLAQLPPLQ